MNRMISDQEFSQNKHAGARKKSIIFGAGNIGRGFIGQVFSLSGYFVTFVDVFPNVVDALNRAGMYPVQIVSDQAVENAVVGPVSAILSSQSDKVIQAIGSVDLMATAVGVNALPAIAPILAAGLRARWQTQNLQPLDIIVCENKLDADTYLRELVRSQLEESEYHLLDEKIGFVEASIGRMVPVMPESLKQTNPLLIQVESYHELPVDAAGFRGPIPDLVELKPFTPFDFFIKRKLFIHNLGHAMTAYLGWIKHYRTIADAIQNPEIHGLVRQAMFESAQALSLAYQIDLKELSDHIEDLLLRFANHKLGDTIARVGRDPLRKLSADDRLAGGFRFALSQGIVPQTIALGIAAGMLYYSPDDPASLAMQQQIKEEGMANFLANHAGFGLSEQAKEWIQPIQSLYQVIGYLGGISL